MTVKTAPTDIRREIAESRRTVNPISLIQMPYSADTKKIAVLFKQRGQFATYERSSMLWVQAIAQSWMTQEAFLNLLSC